MIRKFVFANTEASPEAKVINIEDAIERNRQTSKKLWVGNSLEAYAINLKRGEELGIESLPDSDQFLKIESGTAKILFGNSYERIVDDDYAIFIPANTEYNIINVDNDDLKVLSIISK